MRIAAQRASVRRQATNDLARCTVFLHHLTLVRRFIQTSAKYVKCALMVAVPEVMLERCASSFPSCALGLGEHIRPVRPEAALILDTKADVEQYSNMLFAS